IATTLLERIDHYYSCISDNIFEIYEKWRSNNYAIGKHVELKLLQKSVISGMLVDTDPVDGVLIKSTNGTLIRYRFENIQHIQITKSPD
ncbi:MAG: hypothetical protein HY606_13535, partial [Planctomycetes bacterium]|nr:hypothetical protein [Planctomycetota bacterium]